MSSPHILMCPPDYYGIEYEINPWMNRERQSNHQAAVDQWNALKGILEELGARVSLLEPQKGLPDLVFTANAGLVFRDRVILSHFRHEQRQGEETHDEAWFAAQGLDVQRVAEEVYFEGAGDSLFCGETLYAGYRIRSDAIAHQQIAEQLGVRVIPLELVDPYYYHLDTCFCPLAPGVALYYPAAFDDYGRQAINEHIEQLIEVDESEARNFAANAVVVGNTVVTNTGCPRLHARLGDAGFQTIDTPLDEFVKAGGSAKCLTLRIDGEEAAVWQAAE